MRIHARTLKFAAPLALLLVVGAMSPALAAPKAAASGTGHVRRNRERDQPRDTGLEEHRQPATH